MKSKPVEGECDSFRHSLEHQAAAFKVAIYSIPHITRLKRTPRNLGKIDMADHSVRVIVVVHTKRYMSVGWRLLQGRQLSTPERFSEVRF